MKPVDLSPFAEACGLTRPIDLRVVRADGAVLAEGEIDIPCAVVGRDPECDVVLGGPEVSLRHACIQAVGGRVMVLDTGSRSGLTVAGHRHKIVWLTPTEPVTVGGYRVSLRRPLFARPTLPDASPLLPYAIPNKLPKVGLRFLNGKSANGEWLVNRPITLVGRAADCKIALAADEIAPYHCYFVHTPAGLWLVDLLTGGVCVNGQSVRFALLRAGDQVDIGRFRVGVHYPDLAAAVTPPPPQPAELKVPTPAPANNLLVEQLAVAQTQMLEQFQTSMTKVFETFGEMQREQVAALQRELTRFAELNLEMQRLQSQLVPVSHHNPLPDPGDVPEVSDETAEAHNWVYERMADLQRERQSLWAKLSGMVQNRAAM